MVKTETYVEEYAGIKLHKRYKIKKFDDIQLNKDGRSSDGIYFGSGMQRYCGHETEIEEIYSFGNYGAQIKISLDGKTYAWSPEWFQVCPLNRSD